MNSEEIIKPNYHREIIECQNKKCKKSLINKHQRMKRGHINGLIVCPACYQNYKINSTFQRLSQEERVNRQKASMKINSEIINSMSVDELLLQSGFFDDKNNKIID